MTDWHAGTIVASNIHHLTHTDKDVDVATNTLQRHCLDAGKAFVPLARLTNTSLRTVTWYLRRGETAIAIEAMQTFLDRLLEQLLKLPTFTDCKVCYDSSKKGIALPIAKGSSSFMYLNVMDDDLFFNEKYVLLPAHIALDSTPDPRRSMSFHIVRVYGTPPLV